MDALSTLGVLTFIALVAVGAVPLYISLRVKTQSLRVLSVLLGAFAITHGLYHLASIYSPEILSEVVLEPISVVFLLAFGLYYSKKGVP
ncbi:MAG TPA: hypothetical protein VGS11_02610 [Candidatus Bathyarchaeia archaeon]|nr:hypothetical protein [Candidatus Bathyarchaeia archaeon]